jgi:hypothetical protein
MRRGDYRSALKVAMLAGMAAAAGADPPDVGDEVFVADRVRTAFFERAPPALRRKMRRAFSAACEAARREPLKDDDGNTLAVEPFCKATRLDFWREVLVTGPRLEEGWICADPEGNNARFKYVVEDILDDEPCVRVIYDYAGRQMTVDLTWHSNS